MNYKDYSEQIYNIIGAAMEVHRMLKGGLLEPVYNEALTMELIDRGINAESEKYLPCYYKGRLMQKSYRMDIVVGDIIVELKSVHKLVSAHRAQLFNYLRLTQKKIGLLQKLFWEQKDLLEQLIEKQELKCNTIKGLIIDKVGGKQNGN